MTNEPRVSQGNVPKDWGFLDAEGTKIIIDTEEKPLHIVGFSMIFSKTPYEIYYKAERLKPKGNPEDLRDQLKKLVERLQEPVLNKFGTPPSNQLSAEDYKYLSLFNSNVTDKKYLVESEINPRLPYIYSKGLDGIEKGKNRKPLLKINQPTLFVFTTNLGSSGTFTNAPIRSQDRNPANLDPNLMNMRQWNNGTVLGVYSDFSHAENRGTRGDFWYHLYLNITLFKGTDNKDVKDSFTLNRFFDPGNGNGGGEEFP